jgi:hypothetical protein
MADAYVISVATEQRNMEENWKDESEEERNSDCVSHSMALLFLGMWASGDEYS